MKKLFFLAALVCSMLAIQNANAQNPVTTLEHAGTTTVFYGQNSLVDAYNASVNGDYLYLSTGYFTAPAAIAKGVKIIGAGHFPDSANVARRTTIMSDISIKAGADSLKLEGMYINGSVNYQADASINYVKVIRCRLDNSSFQSSSETACKNNCSFEECFINGGIYFSKFGTNFSITNSILKGSIGNINGGALIANNIFFSNSGIIFSEILSSTITNNIIVSTINYVFYISNGNIICNNIFGASSINFAAYSSSSNSVSNNYYGVNQSDIFVNQTGNSINYTHDYHLKNPSTYIGTDGTQVGIYGGNSPFKAGGYPSNPQIVKKQVSDKTDANGNLQINFKVKAQDN